MGTHYTPVISVWKAEDLRFPTMLLVAESMPLKVRAEVMNERSL